jgi:hypothetical protein
MCKTIEETARKIKELEVELDSLKKQLELLKKAQCPLCKQRMENICQSNNYLRLGD